MDVLFVSEYFPPDVKGGGELSCYLLAKSLCNFGVNVSVLTSKLSGEEYETKDGIKIYRFLKTGRDPDRFKDNIKRQIYFENSLKNTLVNLQREKKFDIIHCMNITSLPVVKFKEQLNAKLILHVNSPVLFCPKGTLMYKDIEHCTYECKLNVFDDCYKESSLVGKLEIRSFLKKALIKPFIWTRYLSNLDLLHEFDAYMPISTYMQDLLIMQKVPKHKTRVIYNIVNFDKFLDLKLPNNPLFKLLYLGPYTRPKGAMVLLEALKHVKQQYICDYYGSGTLKQDLIKFVKDNNLNVNINDSVPYEQIPEIIETHDVVVVPSLIGEALGRVCIEAIVARKAVVAFNIGGIPDIINNKNGFLVEKGDVCGLVDVIDKIILTRWFPSKTEVIKLQRKFSRKLITTKVIGMYRLILV
jgi:glycosyltransferase involved in cell wall biosynthesis